MLLLTLLASCDSQNLAEKYFRQAADFMPFYNPVYPAGQREPHFDFRSLMIFDSLVGRAAGQQGYPLVSTRRDRPIIMGGNNDPDRAGPSYDDITRLSALYPPPPPPIASFNFQPPGAPLGERSLTGNITEPAQPWLGIEGPAGSQRLLVLYQLKPPLKLQQQTEAQNVGTPCRSSKMVQQESSAHGRPATTAHVPSIIALKTKPRTKNSQSSLPKAWPSWHLLCTSPPSSSAQMLRARTNWAADVFAVRVGSERLYYTSC